MAAPIPAQPRLADANASRFAEQTIAKLKELDARESGGGGVTDHGALTGLADNDHPQYLLATKAAPAQAVWDARVVPAGLHASSDQFTVDTLGSGAWTIWNHGALALTSAVNTARRRLEMSYTGSGAVVWCGAYKANPSNEFTFFAYQTFEEMAAGAGNPFAGLAVFQDATNAAGDFGTFEWERDSNGTDWPLRIRTDLSYNAGGAAIVTRNMIEQPTGRWLMMRVKINPGVPNTLIRASWSTDGESWNEFRTQAGTSLVAATFAAQHFGFAYLQLPAVASRVCWQHFRVFDGVSAFGSVPRNGGYLVAA